MNENLNKNITWQTNFVTRKKREKKNNHKSIAIWFTGLSGSGKSTIANYLEKILFRNHCCSYLLDGDNVRFGLCSDLNFTDTDRKENIRRISEVVKLMLDAGIIVLVSVITPYKNHRKMIRATLGRENILEVFVNTPLSVCENRDPKQLYRNARTGKIDNFTGIQSSYEIPENPDLVLDGTEFLKKNSEKIIKMLYFRKIISFFNF